MASGKSAAQRNQTLDLWLGNTAPTVPATWYVALFTASPTAAGGGTEVSTSGTGYVRVAVTNNTTNWPNATAGLKSNGVEIAFAQATTGWGTVVAVALFDAATSGNMYYWGPLTRSVTINTGQTRRFPIGALEVSET